MEKNETTKEEKLSSGTWEKPAEYNTMNIGSESLKCRKPENQSRCPPEPVPHWWRVAAKASSPLWLRLSAQEQGSTALRKNPGAENRETRGSLIRWDASYTR